MKKYGPTDKWPNHNDKRIKELMRLARSLGWTCEEYTDHRSWAIKCPATEDPCKHRIFGTGAAPEGPTATGFQIVRACLHSVAASSNVIQAREHLDKAERLLTAIELRLDQWGAEREYLLLDAGGGEGDPDVWEDIGVLMDEVDELGMQADALLRGEGLDEDAPLEDVSGVVKESVDRAASLLRKLGGGGNGGAREVKDLRGRVAELRGRHNALRDRIVAVGEE